jgi:hypothetical protein
VTCIPEVGDLRHDPEVLFSSQISLDFGCRWPDFSRQKSPRTAIAFPLSPSPSPRPIACRSNAMRLYPLMFALSSSDCLLAASSSRMAWLISCRHGCHRGDVATHSALCAH